MPNRKWTNCHQQGQTVDKPATEILTNLKTKIHRDKYASIHKGKQTHRLRANQNTEKQTYTVHTKMLKAKNVIIRHVDKGFVFYKIHFKNP